jgi:hypothetical protein
MRVLAPMLRDFKLLIAWLTTPKKRYFRHPDAQPLMQSAGLCFERLHPAAESSKGQLRRRG